MCDKDKVLTECVGQFFEPVERRGWYGLCAAIHPSGQLELHGIDWYCRWVDGRPIRDCVCADDVSWFSLEDVEQVEIREPEEPGKIGDQNEDRIRDMLCSAFEGGPNHWVDWVSFDYGPWFSAEDFADGGRFNKESAYPQYLSVPFVEGCAVSVWELDGLYQGADNPEGKRARLSRQAMRKGIDLMRKEHPKHWTDFEKQNDDATTGDVFLQLCLFGEVIYG